MPTGSFLLYSGTSPPNGWLLCYGQAVSRTGYAALYAVIGTTYGAGDGSNTFNVPDMRGRVGVGLDNMGGVAAGTVAAATSIGVAAGSENHTHTGPSHTHTTGDHALTVTEMASHTHDFSAYSSSGGPQTYPGLNGNGTQGTVTTNVTGSGAAHNHGSTGAAGTGVTGTTSNMSPYVGLNYLIKY
jgi:microcystin-dependent protein